MIINRCPKCGSKKVQEIRYGTEGRNTKTRYYMPEFIFDNINRDFYCSNCRHVYSTDDLKRKAEYENEESNEHVVLCVIFKQPDD